MNSIKLRLALIVIVLSGWCAHAQDNSVGINTRTPDPSAVLHLVSPDGNQGLLIPQLTTDERKCHEPRLRSYWSGSL